VPKLLIADDSVTIQRVVELTFAGHDIQVVPVGDGCQAIARIPVERPDIVPRRHRYADAEWIRSLGVRESRRELAHVPVLLLAGRFEPVDDDRAREVGSDGVIVKPFDPRQMVTRVRELLSASPPPAVESRDPARAAVQEDKSLAEYFDRLDHALHARAVTKPDVVMPLDGATPRRMQPPRTFRRSTPCSTRPPAAIPSAEDSRNNAGGERICLQLADWKSPTTLIDDITLVSSNDSRAGRSGMRCQRSFATSSRNGPGGRAREARVGWTAMDSRACDVDLGIWDFLQCE
jgi:DNA-binding response OmpR family regulator